MVRRLHAKQLFVGEVPLDPAQARHAREVLRLGEGDRVELFDDQGAVAIGTLSLQGAGDATVHVMQIKAAASSSTRLVVASAVPKGERADWMVEKLSELGVDCFIPLQTARSVVRPQGKNKHERWSRIATESAKQSRRNGVMRIEPLTNIQTMTAGGISTCGSAIAFSTASGAALLSSVLSEIRSTSELTLFIGPEGGWTDIELASFQQAAIIQARLTSTILRVETAAVIAAGVVAVLLK